MRHFRRTTNKHLGELLVEREIVTRPQVQQAVEYQKINGGLFGEVLVTLGFATEENIAQALTSQYGFPYLPLANYEIDPEVIKTVPENVCRQFCLIPIDKIGKSLTLAMSNPLNVQAAEDVELITGCMVQVFVATASDIISSISKYYSLNK
jgi:type IV pilus assembly protein PilB